MKGRRGSYVVKKDRASQRIEEEDRTWAPRDQGRFPP